MAADRDHARRWSDSYEVTQEPDRTSGSATQDELYKAEVQRRRLQERRGRQGGRRRWSASARCRLVDDAQPAHLRAPIAGTIRTPLQAARRGGQEPGPGPAVAEHAPAPRRDPGRGAGRPAAARADRRGAALPRRGQPARPRGGGPQAEAEAKELRAQADDLVAVEIEASRPQPPLAVLRGHLQEVTCVAVSRGPNSRIISGSDEGIVRIWERVPGEERWEERGQAQPPRPGPRPRLHPPGGEEEPPADRRPRPAASASSTSTTSRPARS